MYKPLAEQQFGVFTESLGNCGDFSYVATLDDDTALPSGFTFTASNRTITFNTDTPKYTGEITIKVVGSLPYDWYPKGTMRFTVTITGCDTHNIIAPPIATIPDVTYYVNYPKQAVDVNKATVKATLCKDTEVQTIKAIVSSVEPSYVDSYDHPNKTANGVVYIRSTDFSQVADYVVTV